MADINLGDANAFAGDVHITNTTTHIERNKTDEELKAEARSNYRDLCKKALADGIITDEEAVLLEDARIKYDLSQQEAKELMDLAKAAVKRSSKNPLGKIQQITFKQIQTLINQGTEESLEKALERIRPMAQKFDADEVQCNYYMLLEAIHPEECISLYESRDSDSYWQSFWSCMAYINKGDVANAETLIAEMEAWDSMPFGNVALLAAANSLSEYWNDPTLSEFREQAEAFIEEGGSECTDLIDTFSQALILLAGVDNASQLNEFYSDFAFQFDYVLKGITDKIKQRSAKSELPKLRKIDLLND